MHQSITLTNSDNSVEKISNIQHWNYFDFNFYDLRNFACSAFIIQGWPY